MRNSQRCPLCGAHRDPPPDAELLLEMMTFALCAMLFLKLVFWS